MFENTSDDVSSLLDLLCAISGLYHAIPDGGDLNTQTVFIRLSRALAHAVYGFMWSPSKKKNDIHTADGRR